MDNIVSLVLIKGEKLLVSYSSGSYSLPTVKLTKPGDEKERVLQWVKGKVELEGEKIIQNPATITRYGKNINCIMIDATDGEAAVNIEDNGELMWIDNSEIDLLIYFHGEIIKRTLEQCINEGYSSLGVESIKPFVERKLRERDYFDGYKKSLENKTIDEKSSNGKKLGFIGLSILAGILFSLFFFDYLGISVIIYVAYLIVIFILMCEIKNKSLMGYFLLIISMFLACSYGIFTNSIFRTLNIFLLPISLFSSFIMLTYDNLTLELSRFIRVFFKKTFSNAIDTSFKLPKFLKIIIKNEKKEGNSQIYKSVIVGLIISAPILIVLAAFLSGADGMFNYYITSFVDLFKIDNIPIIIYKIITTIIITFFIFGLMWSYSYKLIRDDSNYESKKIFDPVTITTILVMVSILYSVFTKVQVSFLYGAKELPQGLTHAEYARSGFFQLVFVVFINVLSITIFKLKTKNKGKGLEKTLNGIYTLITVLTFNMAFSALYKMNLYIDTFGYTRLRLLVQVFTVFLAIILCILLIFVWKEVNLFKPIVCVAAIMYVSLNFFNIDNYIVQKNINLPKLDQKYLTELSLDSANSMKKALKEKKITEDVYKSWFMNNKTTQRYWYEYNYSVEQGNKLRSNITW